MDRCAVRALALTSLLMACGSPPPPKPPPPPVSLPADAGVVEARRDFALPTAPMALAVAGTALVWTDTAGAIWTMPAAGGDPKQLSDQHSHKFAFHPVVAGGRVFVTTKRDFYAVALPAGPVTALGAKLPEDPEEAVGDDHYLYVTLFKRNEVMRVPIDGGAATKLFDFPRGVLAIHGGTLYAASYSTGVLVAAPTAGGAPKSIARGLDHPTAVAADDTYAFVYTERDKTLHRITLASGATTVLATGLDNADDVVAHDDYVYTYSWGHPGRLLRIAKTGGEPQVLAADLASPRSIVIAGGAVYLTSRDNNLIVRAALPL